jgi:ribonuclease HI
MPLLFPEPSPRVSSDSGQWLIAHCDGGARGNPGPAGYGAVLQTEDGETLAELSEFLGVRTNNYAEYSGLLGVLAWALEHGHRRLRVVSDSELMVKQIQGRYKVNSPDLKPLWTEARSRIAKLAEFQITHALRHKNKDADRLANLAMDRGMGRDSAEPKRELKATPYPKNPASASPMLRGFTRDGVVHVLGEAKLPDGVFVKIVPE